MEITNQETTVQMEPLTQENETQDASSSSIETLAKFLSIILIIVTFPLSLFFCFRVVSEFERAVVFRLGRLKCRKPSGPGIFFILPCVDDINVVDLRTITCIIEPQEILTKDSVTVTVDAVVYYRVADPMKSIIKVADFGYSTRLLAATMLRNVLGTKNLSAILTERETIATLLQSNLDHATHDWGVDVERVEIKDVSLPQQLQRAMAAEAEASREARAKVIAAEGEKQSAQALKEASDVISSSSAALQLRYLQTLNNIASEKNSTIVFPIPVELMTNLFGRNNDK